MQRYSQNEIESQLSDAVPTRGLRREIARRTGIYESVIYGYFNADDPRKSPQFETLFIQAELDGADPAIGESHWQTMCAIREANKGGISEIANLDSEMAKLTSEATDIPVAHLTGESLRKKLQEVRESIAQHKKVEQILIGMMGNDTDCRNIAVAAVSDRQIRKGKRAA